MSPKKHSENINTRADSSWTENPSCPQVLHSFSGGFRGRLAAFQQFRHSMIHLLNVFLWNSVNSVCSVFHITLLISQAHTRTVTGTHTHPHTPSRSSSGRTRTYNQNRRLWFILSWLAPLLQFNCNGLVRGNAEATNMRVKPSHLIQPISFAHFGGIHCSTAHRQVVLLRVEVKDGGMKRKDSNR